MKISGHCPFRQDDPEWRNLAMWDRDKVIETHRLGNSASVQVAEDLLHRFPDGNTIRHEGCLITSLAMILRLLDRSKRGGLWTPAVLNAEAHELNYYTPAGLSMVPLYADIVTEVTGGEVQMCAKEEYLSGTQGWPRTYASTSWLVRAYRQLSPGERGHFAVMLKTGTYDDTFASHYVLLDPDQPGSPDEDDANILDPAMPLDAKRPWRLSDSAKFIRETEEDINVEWDKRKIQPLQLCGVWLFARWRTASDRMLIEPIVTALASEMKSKH